MELLKPGTELPAGDLEAKGVPADAPLVIDQALGELPHGAAYHGRLGHHRVLVTVFEPACYADPEVKKALLHGINRARDLQHPNLLPTYGAVEADGMLYVVRADPQTQTVRQVIHQRMAHGKRTDVQTATALGAEVCDALTKLHPSVVHCFVSPDTVYVTPEGHALLSATGEGALLPHAPGLARFRQAGLLPNAAPELLETPPRALLESDVFGVGVLVIELLCARTVERAGQNVEDLGVVGPPHLLMCLQQAIEPDPRSRQSNLLTLRTELLEAGQSQPATPPAWPGGLGAPPPPPPGGPPAPPFAAGAQPPPPPPGGGPPPAPSAPRRSARPPGSSGPPPPPPKKPSPAASDDWSALDAATKALVDSDALDSMTTGVDGSAPQQSAGTGKRQSFASELGLGIGALDEAAKRLSTLDGQDGLHGVASAVDVHGRRDAERSADLRLEQLQREAMDGEYFGSFAADADHAAKPVEAEAPLVSVEDPNQALIAVRKEDGKLPNYLITRGGVDQGPFSLDDLITMARKGDLVNADTLTLRSDHSQMLAVDHPRLREIFAKRAQADDLRSGAVSSPTDPFSRGRDVVSTRSTPKGSGSGTLLWLVIAIVVFAAAGWVLWQRSGAG